MKAKNEIVKWTCPISSTILYRLKNGYRQLCQNVITSLLTTKDIKGFDEPIFGFHIPNKEIFNNLTYCKQLFLKSHGKDTAKSYMDFFKGEMSIEDAWQISPFKDLDRQFEALNPQEFIARLFSNKNGSWTSTSWDPESCNLTGQILALSAKIENIHGELS